MHAIALDLRAADQASAWPGRALLVAGLASALAAGVHHTRLGDASVAAEAKVRQEGALPGRGPIAVVPARDPRAIALEISQASEVAVQLKLPWNELFASVEAAGMADVALLSIESDTGKRQVNIGAEARDLDSMLRYLRALSRTSALSNVHLQSHRLQDQDPQRPVRFVLAADWASFRR